MIFFGALLLLWFVLWFIRVFCSWRKVNNNFSTAESQWINISATRSASRIFRQHNNGTVALHSLHDVIGGVRWSEATSDRSKHRRLLGFGISDTDKRLNWEDVVRVSRSEEDNLPFNFILCVLRSRTPNAAGRSAFLVVNRWIIARLALFLAAAPETSRKCLGLIVIVVRHVV